MKNLPYVWLHGKWRKRDRPIVLNSKFRDGSTQVNYDSLTSERVFQFFLLFSFTDQNTINSKRSSHFFPTAFSPSKQKQNASLWTKGINQKTKCANPTDEREGNANTNLGDFRRGDPYDDDSPNQEQTSPVFPTHNESSKTHNEKLKKQPKIYVGSVRSHSPLIFQLVRSMWICGILVGGSMNQNVQ